MPKISYLDKDKALLDDTEVTQAQIEAKVAEIEELLRGRIDEDNLLSYQNDIEPIGIPPSIVRDLPAETRPVNNCMKFFGITVDHPDSAVKTVYERSVSLHEANPKYAIVNSVGDKELLIAYAPNEINQNTWNHKIVEVEFPPNYVPVTYRELYDKVKDLTLDVRTKINRTDGLWVHDYYRLTLEGMWFSLEDFMEECVGYPYKGSALDPDTFVNELCFDVGNNRSLTEISEPVYSLEKNIASISASVRVENKTEELLFRVIPSFLFRKIP